MMLKEIQRNEIELGQRDSDEVCDFASEFLRGTAELSGYTDSDLETIIANNINIQAALSSLIYFSYFQDESVHYVTKLGFIDPDHYEEEIRRIRVIFSKIFVETCNGERYGCQVSEVPCRVKNLFRNMVEQNKINKILHHFTCHNRIQQDCERKCFFEYIPKQNSNLVMDEKCREMLADEYIDYILYNPRNIGIQPGIDLTGFTLSEIEEDPYIRIFSQLAEPLYVFNLPETEEDNTYYSKMLRWDHPKINK